MVLPEATSPPRIAPFQPLTSPSSRDLPFVGAALFRQTALTWLALALVLLVAWVLYRTPLGPGGPRGRREPGRRRSPGHQRLRRPHRRGHGRLRPDGVGGAFLTMSAFNAFFFDMVNGRGWICIALVVFASWRPGKALLGALLFGAFDAFQLRLQQEVDRVGVPYQVFLMLPYLLSIVALVAVSRRAAYPQALMVPYRKGER